jgi:hypothetical protein
MLMLQEIVDMICRKTRWKKPVASPGGVYSFALENDLDFQLFSLDGRHLLMESVLFTPAAGTAFDAERAAALLKINAARAGKHKSVLALKDNSKDKTNAPLILFQKIPLKDTPVELILDSLERFLNDAAFWRVQMSTGAAAYSFTSPFSLRR